MASKIITGAVAYREKKGSVEWFLVKSSNSTNWELPKSDVRSGESSVSAILRYLKEGLGVKTTVMEEAGRSTTTSVSNGSSQEQKLVFYLMKQSKSLPEDGIPLRTVVNIEMGWFPYVTARKKLPLIREQKMVSQANDILKEWRKAKKKRPN